MVANMTKQGPDASAFLMLAKGHLVKAREAEASKDSSTYNPPDGLGSYRPCY